MLWPKDESDFAIKLWKSGVSSNEIAKQLHRSRGSVVGHLLRKGLQRKYALDPTHRKYPTPIYVPKQRVSMSKAPKPPVAPKPTKTERQSPPSQRRTVFTVAERDCRFPIGDPRSPQFYFCGAVKKDGSSYCEYHWNVAYRMPQRNAPTGRGGPQAKDQPRKGMR